MLPRLMDSPVALPWVYLRPSRNIGVVSCEVEKIVVEKIHLHNHSIVLLRVAVAALYILLCTFYGAPRTLLLVEGEPTKLSCSCNGARLSLERTCAQEASAHF